MGNWAVFAYLPAYNVQRTAPELTVRMAAVGKKLAARGFTLKQALFVDDGSTDGTAKQLSHLARKHKFVRIIRFKKNRGAMQALFTGMRVSLLSAKKAKLPLKKCIFVRMDSDLEHQPEDLLKLLVPISSGKSRISAGYIPFDARSGTAMRGFNRKIGLEESRRLLRAPIPQFCPGFNAIRGDLFARLAPMLAKKAASFKRATGKTMLTIDIVELAAAKKMGASPAVVRLRKIQGKWLKIADPKKIAAYTVYHRLTMDFLLGKN
ncbi:MAG: glycosyltransferase family 2 protein [Candidatus Micrarchaeota archaeon]|nr:glycosyltransferase family 2 protein [Candidatus Micrarchaeota archaeon]